MLLNNIIGLKEDFGAMAHGDYRTYKKNSNHIIFFIFISPHQSLFLLIFTLAH
jgi:hypothetical protein